VLREQGVRKPILLMARVTDSMMTDLVAHGITLAVYADDDPSRLARVRTRATPIAVHAYIDTGMSRMVFPHRTMPLLGRSPVCDSVD
jgi:alanine racemase